MPGPAPKPKNRRARNNKDDVPRMELKFEPCEAPDLPTVSVDIDGQLHEIRWSPMTVEWWNDWRNSPQAEVFSRSDWRSLLTTAMVAEKFHRTWEVRYAAELRQREAAFGATPIDRLRLRMAWAEDAERGLKVSEKAEAERQREAAKRYGNLHAIDGTDG